VIAAGFDGGQPGKPRVSSRQAEDVPVPEVLAPAADGEPGEPKDAADDGGDQYIELPERKAPRTIVFDDSTSDDLDVPDFLK
jgi:hypothetical protein